MGLLAGSTGAQECLELLCSLADVQRCLPVIVGDGLIKPLIRLLQMPDENVQAAAAQLVAKLAKVPRECTRER